MIKIKNFSNINNDILKKLERDLNALLQLDLVIEAWDSPRKIYSPSQLRRRKIWCRALGHHYNPDESDGEVTGIFRKKVRLFARAFRGRDWKTIIHIALHEIGHYLDKNPLNRFLYRNSEEKADMFASKFGY